MVVMTGPERISCIFFDEDVPDRVPWMEQAIASDVASAILGRQADTGAMLLFQSECEAWLRGDAAHAEWVEKVRKDLVEFAVEMGIDMIGPPWCMGSRPTRKTGPGEYLFEQGQDSASLWKIDPETGAAGWKRIRGREATLEDLPGQIEAMERSLEENPPRESDYEHLLAYREEARGRIEILGSAFLAI